MSVQVCCRDQRKMGRVIDQIKILADNVDELRAEINALRTDYLENREDPSHVNGFKRNKNSKSDILHKMKKYAKKVTSMYSLRKGLKSGSQEPYYRCTNMDPPLSSLLNYVFRTGKKGNVWHIPTRVKHLRDQGNQTNEKPESQQFTFTKSPTTSLNMESIHCDRPLFAIDGNGHYSKIIFPRKDVTLPPNFSELSCELDLQVENPVIRSSGYEVNIFSDSYTVNNYPENMQVSLSNGNDKQSSVKSTQTKVSKLGRKYKNTNYHSKYPNDCFSKIKNAVITKKIIRNSNESTYTICEEVDDTKGYPNLDKERCKRCSCWKKRNKFDESNEQNDIEENCSVLTTVPMLKTNSIMDKSNILENLSEEEADSSPSSVSVDMEVNISNSSNKIEEFPDRRRPRTYVIRKKTQERNQENWSNHFEKSVIYVGQTSDLNLSSYSFSNHNISFN
ncbi:unnamed protein product [Xylocopa violacea]|uniref:Uncharacterized protein n=1 Tax=Xylocopa violacea TaxID=135666 RepID=A0ABP1P182_XYLVO